MSKHRHDSESFKDKNVNPASVQDQTEAPESRQAPESQAAADSQANATVQPAASQVQATGNAGPADSAEKPAGSSTQPSLANELEAFRKENADLKSEVEELNAKYLRKLAEEVNFRKRMLREKEDGQKYALSSILADLIPVLDDFDRGMKAAAAAHSFEILNEGMVLVQRQLSQMLENKYALKRFDSIGSPFDPARHEALFAEPADVEEAIVSEEYLPGYMHHDRVVRSAKVRVKVPSGVKKAATQDAAPSTEPGTSPEAGQRAENGAGQN
jgi:molecular chaperone GrpE